MLRYAIRRLLIALPTLIGISVIVFFVTTLGSGQGVLTAEDSVAAFAADPGAWDAREEQRRARFLDLPRFFNPQPRDVRAVAKECIGHLSADDDQAAFFAHELAGAGGAALPFVLPDLEKLSPAARGRVAVALAPVAERMGVGDPLRLRDPQQAPLYWARFWEDRELDFTAPSVHRTVARFVERPTEEREADLVETDTFAFAELVGAMGTTTDPAALARLMGVAAHARGGDGPRILGTASHEQAQRAVEEWQDWWTVHERDYVALGGAQKVAATFGDTRYGRWLQRLARGDLGRSTQDGEPVLSRLRARATVTFTLALLSLFLSYAAGIPLGVWAAWRRGRRTDTLARFGVVILHAVPVFVAAAVLSAVADGFAGRLTLGVLALAAGSFASVSRQQRSAMLEVLGRDYVRTARAKGARAVRVLVVHALRNALVPLVALAGSELPLLIGGAFVVEVVFRLDGLGSECVRAIAAHDAPELVATLLVVALATTVGLALSDIAYAVLDPRVRDRISRRAGELS